MAGRSWCKGPLRAQVRSGVFQRYQLSIGIASLVTTLTHGVAVLPWLSQVQSSVLDQHSANSISLPLISVKSVSGRKYFAIPYRERGREKFDREWHFLWCIPQGARGKGCTLLNPTLPGLFTNTSLIRRGKWIILFYNPSFLAASVWLCQAEAGISQQSYL